LFGPARTPRDIAAQLRERWAWGVYQIFLQLNSSLASAVPSYPIVALTDWQEDQPYNPEEAQLVFSARSDAHEKSGDIAATVSVYTDAEEWFSFHEDHSAHEERDQLMLERVWSRMHQAMPELDENIEVIESATPQTFYENTRRRFGTIGPAPSPKAITAFQRSPFPNLSLIGDTVTDQPGIDGLAELALKIFRETTS
jgi:hypothetical protein